MIQVKMITGTKYEIEKKCNEELIKIQSSGGIFKDQDIDRLQDGTTKIAIWYDDPNITKEKLNEGR